MQPAQLESGRKGSHDAGRKLASVCNGFKRRCSERVGYSVCWVPGKIGFRELGLKLGLGLRLGLEVAY